MIISKNLKAALFKAAARFHFLNWLFLLIIAFGVVSWTTKFPGSLKSTLWLYILISVLGLLSFLAWILLWGWYSVWFRYLAYKVARVISGIRAFLSSTFIQIVIILALSGWSWLWRKHALQGGDFDLKDLLRLTSMLKILVIAAALFTIWQLIKSRKRIVICDFENFTGDEKLTPMIKGLALICSNEMSRLSKLLKTYDDIHPDAKKDMGKVELSLDVQDIGKDFEEIIGPDSSLKIGNVITVPIRALYGFFWKLLHGPMLTGGVHLHGNKFTLAASLKVGKFKGNWQIWFDETEAHPNPVSEQLNKLTERLVCRMLTDLSPGITPRWRAMYHFTEGLRLYRETLRTETKRALNLIKAKYAFSLSIRDDEKFVQCYFNFGTIYRELESDEAAKAAFREALKKKPDYHQCYYQLAIIYYESYLKESKNGVEENNSQYTLLNAQWFCQQAIAICPTDPSYWDLLAVIQYYSREENAENAVINSSMTGTMLAWRALCKSTIKGEKTSKYKDTALICTRNLAVLIGIRKKKRGKCLFKQAFFLEPDNNDLHFEAGQYFYRMKDIANAYKAFKRVFEDDEEVSDPFSYWALYVNVNAQLYKKEKNKIKKKEFKNAVDNGYVHFLDAAAEVIHTDESYDDNTIKENEELVSVALELTNISNKAEQRIFLVEFINFIRRDLENKNIVQRRDSINAMLSQFRSESEGNFFTWVKTQIDIKLAILILEEKDKEHFTTAASILAASIDILKDEYPNELKILGLYRYLAMAYLLIGAYEEALNSAREAVNLNPYDPDVREVLGEVYFRLKSYKQAVIEFEISFNVGNPSLHILEKIGEAYKEEGKILHDPVKRKESFTKAADFFKECYDIIDDKSYEANVQEDESYIETLGKIHFNLAYFYREILQYDDAVSHYQIALEMVKALKSNDDILGILLQMGWIYLEAQAFAEAEIAFNDAKSYMDVPPLAKTEIDIGLMFSRVERSISFDRNVWLEDAVKTWVENTETNVDAKDNKFQEKTRLLSLYHECLGRYFSLQGKMEEAEKSFEKSISFMPNPRVYLYLAEFYLREISGSRIGRKETLIAKARNACNLCRKHDLRLQYEKELADLEKKLD
ncbi:MAG: hypothetical protein QG657_703 [Acidobacteriota bacterium]|nr:hypothetical protein [Acidobacteriota bacterium]